MLFELSILTCDLSALLLSLYEFLTDFVNDRVMLLADLS